MTPQLNTASDPLSRISIASLEDLGYQVDYSTADPFGRSNLNPSCLCNRREQRSVLDSPHGETRQLGLGSPATKLRRVLSEEMRAYAVEYGRSILQKRKTEEASRVKSSLPKGLVYAGDKVISVLVKDVDGGIYSVIVKSY